jgi:hypothetical protein
LGVLGAEWGELSDRQKRRLEARAIFNEDEEFRHKPLIWIAQDRRGYAMYKDRWAEVLGLVSGSGAWDIDCMPVADFGNQTFVGTVRTGFSMLPLVNPAMTVLKSPDPEPFQDPGGLITGAVIGDRQIGTALRPIVILIGAYVYHATAAAGVFQPAASTINIRVQSCALTVGGAFTTLATLVLNTAANFIDQIPIVGTTGRFVSLEGGANAAAAALFNGDAVFAEMVAGASLQGNVVYAMLELA